MPADRMSIWSYEAIVESGYIGEKQAQVLAIFTQHPGTRFTASQVKRMMNVQSQSETIRNRITELTQKGMLKKSVPTTDEITKRAVNTWEWTGRLRPLEGTEEWCECKHCDGKGGKVQTVYREAPTDQMNLPLEEVQSEQ